MTEQQQRREDRSDERGYRDADRTRARDIMSRRVVAILEDADLMVAVDTFLRHGLRHLVVVDEDRGCRGLLSVERALAALGTTGGGSRTVREHLPAPCARVHQDASVRRTAEAMILELVDALPVVDDADRVVGVVTWSDIVAMVAGRRR